MIEVTIHNPIKAVDDPISGKIRIEFIAPKKPLFFWSSYAERESIQYPKGYGVAYRDENSNRILLAYMPLNILAGFAIWSYQWFRIGFAAWCWKHRPTAK